MKSESIKPVTNGIFIDIALDPKQFLDHAGFGTLAEICQIAVYAAFQNRAGIICGIGSEAFIAGTVNWLIKGEVIGQEPVKGKIPA